MVEETEKVEVGDKYKLTFLQMDKRFVDLELAVGELSEKLKAFDSKVIADLQEKVENLESLITAENLGMIELKRTTENLEKKIEEIPKAFSLSPEILSQITSSVMPSLESSILPKIETHISEIKEKLAKPFDEEIVKKIVSEVSDLRTEVSKEIRYIKEKIEGEKVTKSDIDLKFLSSRVNTLKESVDFLINRKIEMDQKIQSLEGVLSRVSGMPGVLPENIIENVENTRKELAIASSKIDAMERSIEKISENVERFENLIKKFERAEVPSKEIEKIPFAMPEEINERLASLEKKLNLIESEIRKEKEKKYLPEKRMPTDFYREIDELINRIVALETRIGALERTLQEAAKIKPVVLE